MIKFQIHTDSFKDFAKELRIASWGVSVITATIIFEGDDILSFIMGALAWTALQALGFVASSMKIPEKE